VRQTDVISRTGSADKSETAAIDLTWVVTGATWLAVALLVCGVAGDPDFWGHLRFGLDTLAQRQLTAVDPYSFTQDVPWVNHEWLSELLMAGAFQTAGLAGMLLLKLAVVFSAFALLWRAWRPVHPLVTFVAMVIAAFGAVPLTRTTRPQMWTLLFLLILVSLLQRSPNVKVLGAIALLFTAWINLHGGAILGMGVVGLWAAVAAVVSWRESRAVPWPWLLVPVVAALATLVNPYGPDIWRFLFETVRPGRDITEWQPLWTKVPQLWLPLAVTVSAILVWRLFPSWPAIAVILLLWYGGITVGRIAYLAVPMTVLLIAPVAAIRWPRSLWEWRGPRAAAGVMLVPLLVIASLVVELVGETISCVPIGDQDPAGVARLHATQGTGRLVVWFDWGEYAIWHLSPRLKVSWDGRRETIYSEAAQETQKAVAAGRPRGDEWLAANQPEYVWLPAKHTKRRDWLVANGYRLDHETDTSFIAVRADLPTLPEAATFPSCERY
jgi:hypothetical protein